jgi:hypothetical protein
MIATASANGSTLSPVLSDSYLRRVVPSAYAETPWHAMSDRYGFVPTSTIIGRLAREGFHPVRALQSKSRTEGKADFTRHMIRFRHLDHLRPSVVGDELPELVLTNSHDGTSAYQLAAGIYRLVCSNGMVVQSADFGTVSVRHTGSGDFADRIIDATYEVLGSTQLTMDRIDAWKGIALDPPQRLALASAAVELRPNGVAPEALLTTRRSADRDGSLWTTANVIQENYMKGGVYGRNPDTGRRFRTRPVGSVSEDLRINRALWTLTERLAELAR